MNGLLLVVESHPDDCDDDDDEEEEEVDDDDFIDATRKFVHTISWTLMVNNPSVNCILGKLILRFHNQHTNAL